MEMQQQIDRLRATTRRLQIGIVALVIGAVIWELRPVPAPVIPPVPPPVLNVSYDSITCKEWRVIDKDGKERIHAGTNPDGAVTMQWIDPDGKVRIVAASFVDGQSGVQWYDRNGKVRIGAGTNADGDASILWFDSDGNRRINAMTRPDGTVILPNSESK